MPSYSKIIAMNQLLSGPRLMMCSWWCSPSCSWCSTSSTGPCVCTGGRGDSEWGWWASNSEDMEETRSSPPPPYSTLIDWPRTISMLDSLLVNIATLWLINHFKIYLCRHLYKLLWKRLSKEQQRSYQQELQETPASTSGLSGMLSSNL